MRFNASWKERTTLDFFWLALAMIWTATTAQAQMIYIDVYPSQDNPDSKTIWIFGSELQTGSVVSSTAHYTSTIRSEGNYHARDSWKVGHSPHWTAITNFYPANKPTNQLVSLSPLFSSTNNPRDIESIQVRGFFGSNRTNPPTVTTGSGSKTIGSIFMNDDAQDEIGIRHTGAVICGIPTGNRPFGLAPAF